MARKKPAEINLYFQQIPDLRNKWPMFLTLGILLIILGILAIIYSGWTTFLTVELLGVLLVIAGVFQIVNGYHARKWTGVSLSLLLGILYIVVGGICIFKPMASAMGVTLLLAAFFFVGGLFRMASSLMYRFDHWGWMFFNGLVSFILGILIVCEWPMSSFWLIGLFVGIDILFSGISWTCLSLAAKKQLK
jgi:uncharacterized membrane protein HdeD (DUF308 family)